MTTSDAFASSYILYVKPYQETSALVETFCREQGRVGMVFRRVRGGKSSKNGLLQPFQPLWINYDGQHELRNGRQLEARGPSVWLTGTALISGLYLNELLVRVLHRDDPHPQLFDCYEATLQALLEYTVQQKDIEPCLRQFEHRLLAEMGYDIDFYADANGEPLLPQQNYRYQQEYGFLPQSSARNMAENGIPGEYLQAIAIGDYHQPEVRRAAKRLFRQALAPHLGDKPLVSRSLFRSGNQVKS